MKHWLLLRAVAASLALFVPSEARPDDSSFDALLNYVPASANVIVTLNAERIFASEVAMNGGWKQQYESTYSDSPLLLPPSAQQFVLAADLDLAHFQPRWQAAVMRLSTDPGPGSIARLVSGEQDRLAGLDVVSTPKGAMIVKFGPHLFGMRQPGDRQLVGRWIQESKSRTSPPLSPYLQAAAGVPDRVGTEIIMALDLTDALGQERVRQAMSRSAVLQEKSVQPDAAADVLTSIKGMTLGARVTKRVYGVLRIDFERDVAVLADVAKPLLLETLGKAGASIDEFADWNVKVEERRISLDGELTRDGLRRLFSFLEIDSTAVDTTNRKTAATDDAMEPSVDAYTSLEYFQSIARHFNDLKRERGASSYYTIAVWFDKYARRIDRLPILHVDKDLVNYGQRTVSQLRNCVEAIRGAGIRSGARSAQVTSGDVGYDYGYAPYALFSGASQATVAQAQVGAVEQERRAIRAQEQGQSSMDVRAIIRQIEEDTSNIRRQMTERYNIEFELTPRRTNTQPTAATG
jgi:hypothetical protein